MKSQDVWDGNYKLHNIPWNIEVKEEKVTTEKIVPQKIEPKTEIKKEEIVEKIEEEPKKEEPIQVKKEPKKEEINENLKIKIACLPAKLKEYTNFYGEEIKSISYESPFIFEGYIMEQQDIVIKIYSETPINNGSIIFPKNESKRWWKVKSFKDKIIIGFPSEIQPSFEDVS